ncbi:MAG: hypothetical protein QOG48_2382 [Verrucomicrobiota bacterium]|jgi:hypothetical protein
MNIDDPKLTAFALDEFDEPKRSTIARAVAESPEAQRYVDETREMARALKEEFAAELKTESSRPMNLIDIRDDPWFWAKARPLALAASIALFAIIAAIGLAKYRTNRDIVRSDGSPVEVESDLPLPNTMPNPIAVNSVGKIDHIVVAEVVDPQPGGERHPIEVINDAYRIAKMQKRLSTPTLLRNVDRGVNSRIYELVFFERGGAEVATAHFYRARNGKFVLQLLQSAKTHGGIDLSDYVVPFSDWMEAIGYAPGA